MRVICHNEPGTTARFQLIDWVLPRDGSDAREHRIEVQHIDQSIGYTNPDDCPEEDRFSDNDLDIMINDRRIAILNISGGIAAIHKLRPDGTVSDTYTLGAV